jgi:hypothetical protein
MALSAFSINQSDEDAFYQLLIHLMTVESNPAKLKTIEKDLIDI